MSVLVAPNAILYQHLIVSVALGSVLRTRKVFVASHATTKLQYNNGAPHSQCGTLTLVAW